MPFFLSISLIIKHTAEVHEQVADLLRQLRRLQDLQVSVEVRFITVNDTFFEFIGVDFDFQIQSDTVGKHTTFAVPNPIVSLFPISGLTTGTITGTDQHRRAASASARPAGGSDRRRRLVIDHGGSSTGGGGRPAAAEQRRRRNSRRHGRRRRPADGRRYGGRVDRRCRRRSLSIS